ncbi:SubName: Full=Related to secreted protein-Streptomyces sviceus {ECO:0000313/EMBL:CCA74311.1} [Serendipita indica DSM 11827]|nr:SubName: Full=Related to secreted protein-Streptomyces sviceus {ECO:0000313/EMBL:CCA74311.1} [Serendipita indica DSM 11827]
MQLLLTLFPSLTAFFASMISDPAPAANITAYAPASFVHPGVLLNTAQLNFIRSKVNAGAQPWSGAYSALLKEQLLSQSRNPTPRSVVNCGRSSNPDNGCTNERQDALAAYGNALAWYVSQDSKYAKKAISYFNAWSGVITDHTGPNAPLQTAWSGTSWARAAEIIRHTYSGWASSDITKFESMLRNVYLSAIINGDPRTGNWDLVMMEASQGIAVFLNDKASYDKAMNRYLGRVPAFVYLETDSSYPKAAPGSPQTTKAQIISFWHDQSTFVNGIAQETCRDFVHTGYSIASIGHVAETSRIQGTDLYTGEVGTRLRHALGFHSLYQLGATVPSWLCKGKLILGLGPVTEIGFNAMNTRLGYGMANTQILTQNQRPAGTNWLFLGWETLTHAGNTA